MSSVEASYREGLSDDDKDDSLSEQLEQVMKNNKISRNRSGGRGSRNANSQDSVNSQVLHKYLFGKFDLASQTCKKLIASNPQNPQPYFLMATMHQQAAQLNNDRKELEKSVDYFFFHAFYSQPSVQKWKYVADMSYNLELYMQAAYCYGRALKINKSNIQLSLKRAQCLQKCFQIKKAVNIYKRILQKVSNSIQAIKKYARLRFRRQQYAKARQILCSYPNTENNLSIKYMIAETYLKEKKFVELYQYIITKIIKQSQTPITNIFEQLDLQFIEHLFICRVNCPEQTSGDLKIQDMLNFLKDQYNPQQPQMYEQIISYIKKQNPQVTFNLLSFLLKYQTFQTIENYLYCSEYLMHTGHCRQAIQILQQGLSTSKNQNSVQLKTQLNYLKTLLKNKNKSSLVSKSSKKIQITPKKQKQDIFYSDEDEVQKKQQDSNSQNIHLGEKIKFKQQSYFEQSFENEEEKKERKKKKIKKTKKKSIKPLIHHIQVKDPQIVSKLIQNNEVTLSTLKNDLESLMQKKSENLQHSLTKTFSQIKDCLQYLVQIQGSNRQIQNQEITQNARANQSIFNNKQPKKRRTILGKNPRRLNLISRNSSNLLQSLKHVIYFMKEYLKNNKYYQVIDFAQMLSKAHFFKWQNRILQFKALKREVYQMGVLACLQLQKYGKSIFFLRYLINKNPQNQFYLSMAQKVMRLSTGKLFINSMVKKGVDWQTHTKNLNLTQKDLIKMHYMTGLEYMENCFFELAINMFAKVINAVQSHDINSNQESREICKTTYMCMSTCFLQMASSRTVFNKLDHVNRSAFCFAKYKHYSQQRQKFEVIYNQARWYSFVKVYAKAIPNYQIIIELCKNEDLVQRSVLNLMIIYKDLENFDKIKQLAEKHSKLLCQT